MLWAIDSCQNKVSAGQYHLTLSRAQVSTHPGRLFFLKLSADKLLAFKWSKALFKFIRNMLCLYHQGPALLTVWFQTDLGPENSIKMQAGKMLFTFLTIVTRWSRFTSNLCSIIGQKFDRWVHTENLCRILRLVHFDSRSWQRFVSTCDVFNCLFPLDVQNEIQLLSRVFCYSWLVYILNFWLRNAPLVKVGNAISDGIVFVFHLAGCVRE